MKLKIIIAVIVLIVLLIIILLATKVLWVNNNLFSICIYFIFFTAKLFVIFINFLKYYNIVKSYSLFNFLYLYSTNIINQLFYIKNIYLNNRYLRNKHL